MRPENKTSGQQPTSPQEHFRTTTKQTTGTHHLAAGGSSHDEHDSVRVHQLLGQQSVAAVGNKAAKLLKRNVVSLAEQVLQLGVADGLATHETPQLATLQKTRPVLVDEVEHCALAGEKERRETCAGPHCRRGLPVRIGPPLPDSPCRAAAPPAGRSSGHSSTLWHQDAVARSKALGYRLFHWFHHHCLSAVGSRCERESSEPDSRPERESPSSLARWAKRVLTPAAPDVPSTMMPALRLGGLRVV